MNRLHVAISVIIFSLIFSVNTVLAEEPARIVLLNVDDNIPNAEDVAEVLRRHLEPVGVWVDIIMAKQLPENESQWRDIAKEIAGDEPGTLAFLGWKCGGSYNLDCNLFVIETIRFSVVEIPVRPRQLTKNDQKNSVSYALAATIRETIWGGLFDELNRLVAEGEQPSDPPPIGARIPRPNIVENNEIKLAETTRPQFWLEGGYQGDYPYPGGNPMHGPQLGIALSPGKNVVPSVGIGWLGVRKEENNTGLIRVHRFPASVAIRIIFPVGLAMFSIAPIARLDIVFVDINPHGLHDNSTQTELEFNIGGMTTWNLPLSLNKLEIVLGFGILATVIGHDYKVENVVTVPSSKFRIVWSIGFAWSPLSD